MYLILVLSCCLTGTYAQSMTPYADSILSEIEQSKGRKRAELVADYTRNANFYETDHYPFKSYLEEAFEWETDHPDPGLLNTLRLGLVNMLVAERKDKEVMFQLQEILHSGEELSRKDSVSTYSFLYAQYSYAHAYPEAWEMLRIRDGILARNTEESDFFSGFQKIQLNDLGYHSLITNRYEDALTHYRKRLSIAKEESDFFHGAGAYNNLGIVYLKMQEPDSAMLSFNSALTSWQRYFDTPGERSSHDSSFFHILYGNLGTAYNQKGMYRTAIPMLEQEIERFEKTGENDLVVNGLHELVRSLMGLTHYSNAGEKLQLASELLAANPFTRGIRANLELRVELLEKTGNDREALALFKDLVAFNDSLAEVEDEARTSILRVAYEVEQKNHELSSQKIRIAKAEADAERQKRRQQTLQIGIILMVSVVTFLIVLVILRKSREKRLKEQNSQIEHQKRIIEKSLVEKETLLKEIHHRVKNNLQLISGILELQAISTDDHNVKDVMEEGQNRIRSIALLHQQLYQSDDLGQIDFQEYLNKLVNDIAILFAKEDHKIDIEISVNGLTFDVSVAVCLGLIINELVTNSFNHGFEGRKSGRIFIGIRVLKENLYELTVSDDGTGLPEGINPERLNSLGLMLVKGLSRQLGGNYRFENDNGARFTIQFTSDHEGKQNQDFNR